nr:ATP-binding protein [Ardenticatena sp.]
MNRFWVRLSLAFTTLILFFFVVPVMVVALNTAGILRNAPPELHHNIPPTSVVPRRQANPPMNRPLRRLTLDADAYRQAFRRAFLEGLPGFLTRTTVVAGILGLALGIWFSRSLTEPLSRLEQGARAVAMRNWSYRVPEEGPEEVVEVARAFNEMTTALQQSEMLRRQLLSDVAHELRTPLTVLQGNLRAMLDGVYPLEPAEIGRLYDQTRHLSRLVEDLHLLAQAEAQALPLTRTCFDLRDLVREVVELFRPLAEARHVQLTLESAETPLPVEADRARIQQILNNFLSNALRHTPEGGHITVRAARETNRGRVEVQDTGEGIAPEHLPHVFERFYRADKARDRQHGGTGLGLAIAKALAEAHGGGVWAASDGKGKGATFGFWLPLRTAAEQNEA